MTYVARKWDDNDLIPHMVEKWGVFDTVTGECIFGDNMPRDAQEAQQCARAANLAQSIVVQDLRKKMRKLLESV